MDIDMDSAHKSTVRCWRELLRHLNTLNASELSGGKYKNLPQTNFVAFGSNNSELMDGILHFMLMDLPIDSDTRSEIFLNNLKDSVCLNLFKDPPESVFVHKEDPKAKETLKQQILDIQTQLREVKMNILLLNSDEQMEKIKEMHKKDILDLHLTRFKKDLDQIHPFLVEQQYIAWVIGNMVEKSVKDCQHIIDASDRVSQSPFSQMHRTYLNTVAVEIHSEVTPRPSAHKTSI